MGGIRKLTDMCHGTKNFLNGIGPLDHATDTGTSIQGVQDIMIPTSLAILRSTIIILRIIARNLSTKVDYMIIQEALQTVN